MAFNQNLYLSFEALFREHYESLAHYAFSILRNKEDAEDVVQDVFVKIWNNTPHIIENPQAKFYLLTAVKNSCISFLRKKAGKVYVQPEEVNLQAVEEEKQEQKQSGGRDAGAMIEHALSLLPPQCLAIFKLSRFGKLSYREIAEELDLSVKTVENQVGKALRLMRDYAKKNNISLFWGTIILAIG